jgi:hypothetical protein
VVFTVTVTVTATATGSAVAIPAGALVPVFVPAGGAVALSYDEAPTWAVNGR